MEPTVQMVSEYRDKIPEHRLVDVLTGLGIHYKATTKKALNINCPYCLRPDTGHHCGIFFSTARFHCFRCGAVGTLAHLLAKDTGRPVDEFKQILGQGRVDESPLSLVDRIKATLNSQPAPPTEAQPPKTTLPGTPVSDWMLKVYPELNSFLKRRTLSLEVCQQRQCLYSGRQGDYSYRLILPVFHGGRVVSWQGRDITDKQKEKYQSPPNNPLKHYLYWFEDPIKYANAWGRRVLLVEGIFDCWRTGPGAAALFGKEATREQRLVLIGLRHLIDEIVICMDADAQSYAYALAKSLSPFFGKVVWAKLPEGKDPDTLGREALLNLPTVCV
jgi:hypothetical protein